MSRKTSVGRILGSGVLMLFLAGSLPLLADGDHPSDHPSDHPKKEHPKAGPPKASPKGDAYPLETCIVDGAKLDSKGGAVAHEQNGRDLRFCGKDCLEKFKKDPAGYVTRLDEAIIKEQTGAYPLTTCPVSGDKLGGEMGKPVDRVHMNRLVRFCCPDCIKEFEKDPAKFLAKIDKAVIDRDLPNYPLTTCPVSGDKLGGEMGKPIDYVHANRLIRFCCPDCIKTFRKTPGKYMAKVEEAMKKNPPKPDGEKADEHTPGDHSHGEHAH